MNKNEKIYADLLDSRNIKWNFHSHKFNVGDTTYQPDFYLIEEMKHVEIMTGSTAYNANKKKIKKFQRMYPNIKFEILSPRGEKFFVNNKIVIKQTRITFNIDSELKLKIQLKACEENKNITEVMLYLLNRWIEK